MLEKVEEVVLGLTRLLDSRVFVALGRGLWDFTAKDVYDYVESLQEDRHNKARPCCPHKLGQCPEPASPVITRPWLPQPFAAVSSLCYKIVWDETNSHALCGLPAVKGLTMVLTGPPWSCQWFPSSRGMAQHM